jgi:hypothetical protein
MSLALGSDPAWGFVEWAVTGLSTLTLSAAAFVWRMTARLDRASSAIEWQRTELVSAKQANDAAALRLADRVAKLQDDQSRLREAVASLPTRADLRDMEERVGARVEALAGRFDRAIAGRGG